DLRQGFVVFVQQLQQQCGPYRCVSPEVNLREYYTAVAFAAHRRLLVAHPDRDVDFPDWGANGRAASFTPYILDDPAGRKVRAHGPAAVPKHKPGREREREIFANGLAGIRHECEAIDVGIHRESNRRSTLLHERFQLAKVLSDRLWRSGKAAV